jgi:hypothetical protein
MAVTFAPMSGAGFWIACFSCSGALTASQTRMASVVVPKARKPKRNEPSLWKTPPKEDVLNGFQRNEREAPDHT